MRITFGKPEMTRTGVQVNVYVEGYEGECVIERDHDSAFWKASADHAPLYSRCISRPLMETIVADEIRATWD